METPAKSPPTPARNPRSGGKEGRREGGTERGGGGGLPQLPGASGARTPGTANPRAEEAPRPRCQRPSGGRGKLGGARGEEGNRLRRWILAEGRGGPDPGSLSAELGTRGPSPLTRPAGSWHPGTTIDLTHQMWTVYRQNSDKEINCRR